MQAAVHLHFQPVMPDEWVLERAEWAPNACKMKTATLQSNALFGVLRFSVFFWLKDFGGVQGPLGVVSCHGP